MLLWSVSFGYIHSFVDVEAGLLFLYYLKNTSRNSTSNKSFALPEPNVLVVDETMNEGINWGLPARADEDSDRSRIGESLAPSDLSCGGLTSVNSPRPAQSRKGSEMLLATSPRLPSYGRPE
jgi:hypothetical protein